MGWRGGISDGVGRERGVAADLPSGLPGKKVKVAEIEEDGWSWRGRKVMMGFSE